MTKLRALKHWSPDLLNQWVIFTLPETLLRAALGDSDYHKAEVNGGLGYVYVDHEAGITLSMDWTVSIADDGSCQNIDYLLEPGRGIGLRFRYSTLSQDFRFQPLSLDHLKTMQLPDEPDWYQIYRPSSAVEWMRQAPDFDDLRAEGFPDDLSFLIAAPDNPALGSEKVWGRFEGFSERGQILLRLMNRPHQDFGISMGDLLPVAWTDLGDEEVLVWVPDFGMLEALPDITLVMNHVAADGSIQVLNLKNVRD